MYGKRFATLVISNRNTGHRAAPARCAGRSAAAAGQSWILSIGKNANRAAYGAMPACGYRPENVRDEDADTSAEVYFPDRFMIPQRRNSWTAWVVPWSGRTLFTRSRF